MRRIFTNIKLAGALGGTVLAAAALMASCSSGSRTISNLDEEGRGSGNLDSPATAERHGCCNGHGGACGCGNGKVQCCDGTASRNCGCE